MCINIAAPKILKTESADARGMKREHDTVESESMSVSSRRLPTEFKLQDARGKGAAYADPSWESTLAPRVHKDYRRQSNLWIKPYNPTGKLKPFEQSSYVVKAQIASVTICTPRKVNGVLLTGTCIVYADLNSAVKYERNNMPSTADYDEMTENLRMLSQRNPDEITIKLCERDHPLSMNPQPANHNKESSLTKVRVTVQGVSLKARIDLENVQSIVSKDIDAPLERRMQSPTSSKKRKSSTGTSYLSASSDTPRLTSPDLIEHILKQLDQQAQRNTELLQILVTQNKKDGNHRQQYPPPQPDVQIQSTLDLSRSIASCTLPVQQLDKSNNHDPFPLLVDQSSPNFQFDDGTDTDAWSQSFHSNSSAHWNQG